jgi:site-specific recombinase XerD
MITIKKIPDINIGYKTVDSFVIEQNATPLVAPSAFLLQLSKSGSYKTVATYASHLKSFFGVLEDMKGSAADEWQFITDREMNGYIYGVLHQKKGLLSNSIDNHIACLNAFYGFAYKHGLITTPCEFSFSYGGEDVEGWQDAITNEMHEQYYSESEFEKVILNHLQAKSSFVSDRNELMMKVGYFLGLRSFEVVHPKNFVLSAMNKALPKSEPVKPQFIEIFGKGKKVRNVSCPVALLENFHTYLWRYQNILTKSSGNIFCRPNGTPIATENYATTLFTDARNAYLERKDISAEDRTLWIKRTFHKSRKCFATNYVAHCYENELDPYIQLPQVMGHSNISTTFKYIYFEALLNKRQSRLSELSLEYTRMHEKRFGGKKQ